MVESPLATFMERKDFQKSLPIFAIKKKESLPLNTLQPPPKRGDGER